MSKWIEATLWQINDAKAVVKFLQNNIFARFNIPRAIISDEGTHFCNRMFVVALTKYRIKHKVAIIYYSQTSGWAELSNKEIKEIYEKMVNPSRRDWYIILDDSYGLLELPTKHHLACLHVELFMVKLVICH